MRTLLFVLAILCLPVTALAADDVAVELVGKALYGQSKPALILHANKALANGRATLTRRGDGKKVTLHAGIIKAGGTQKLEFDAPPGNSHYTGELHVEFIDGTSGTMPLSFSVNVSKGIALEVSEDRFDVKKGEMGVKMNSSAERCEYEVDFDGKESRKGVTQFGGAAAGTWLKVSWPPHGADDVVLRVALKCHDTDGFFAPMESFPWSLSIPHDDINFATAKWDIEPGERAKLDRAMEDVLTTVRRYGKVPNLKPKLFIAGHTDTVGDSGSNVTLSINRARAIAAYFKAKGIGIPVLYHGFGESNLAVATADETDERKNRRAEYILSHNRPWNVGWQPLDK